MIELENVNLSIKNRKILHNINFKSKEKKLIAIIGPNGSGKSSLLKVLRNFFAKESGKVKLLNKDLEEYTNKELSLLISYLPQTTKAVSCLVEDCIMLGRKPHMKFLPSQKDFLKCQSIIKELNLEKLVKKNLIYLSGGELQKALIARSFVQEASILFLDEPINHLDIKNQLDIMNLTKKLTHKNNLLSFIVLHDLNLAFKYADNILLLKNGKILYFGEKENLDEKTLQKAYEVDLKLINYEGEIKAIY